MGQPETILEYLTAKNQQFTYVPRYESQTRNERFYEPVQLTEWPDFAYENLQNLYGGTRIRDALQTPCSDIIGKLLSVQDHERRLHDHDSTKDFYTVCNKKIVQDMLDLVKEDLQPCTWYIDKVTWIQRN